MLRPTLFDPLKPMFFDNAFDKFFNHSLPDFGSGEFDLMKGFRTDIIDQGDHYLLQAELPGFAKEDINIELTDNNLTISAVHNKELNEDDKTHNYIRRERHFSSYSRSFYAEGITANDIDASYKDGILEVNFPKKEVAQKEEPKKIEIK